MGWPLSRARHRSLFAHPDRTACGHLRVEMSSCRPVRSRPRRHRPLQRLGERGGETEHALGRARCRRGEAVRADFVLVFSVVLLVRAVLVTWYRDDVLLLGSRLEGGGVSFGPRLTRLSLSLTGVPYVIVPTDGASGSVALRSINNALHLTVTTVCWFTTCQVHITLILKLHLRS
jgi:hypothetical protein